MTQLPMPGQTPLSAGLSVQDKLLRQQMLKDAITAARDTRQQTAQTRQKQSADAELFKTAYTEAVGGDLTAMDNLFIANPEMYQTIQAKVGLDDSAKAAQGMKQAAMLRHLLATNQSDQAVTVFNQMADNNALSPVLKGLADNFQAGDFEGAANEMDIGFSLFPEDIRTPYADLFGRGEKPGSAFVQDLIVSGMEPGSDDFKAAILDKYGKGKTIGFDVKEAINPKTKKNEYVQISRTDPTDTYWTGLEVPPDAAVTKAQTVAEKTEKTAYDNAQRTLGLVDRMLKSPALSGDLAGAVGIGSWLPTIPGTEKANFEAMLDTLSSQQFTNEISALKGMGSLSDAEGKKIAAAAETLSPTMSPKAFRVALERIKTSLATVKAPGSYKNDTEDGKEISDEDLLSKYMD